MHILGPGTHILNKVGRPCPSILDIDQLSLNVLNGEDIEDCLNLSIYTGNVSILAYTLKYETQESKNQNNSITDEIN